MQGSNTIGSRSSGKSTLRQVDKMEEAEGIGKIEERAKAGRVPGPDYDANVSLTAVENHGEIFKHKQHSTAG